MRECTLVFSTSTIRHPEKRRKNKEKTMEKAVKRTLVLKWQKKSSGTPSQASLRAVLFYQSFEISHFDSTEAQT